MTKAEKQKRVENNKKAIKPGFVVKYRNKKMTVEVIGPDYAVCVWIEGDKKGKKLFDFDQLSVIST